MTALEVLAILESAVLDGEGEHDSTTLRERVNNNIKLDEPWVFVAI